LFSGLCFGLASQACEAVMSYQVSRYVDLVTQYAGRLDREQWVTISVLVLVLGLITLRGFGSRSNY